ncbi:MAG TPA: hypothetical protein VG734_26875 [Lacunisphaera sp.]|nr:hypothetical protein [Lacunisphaera sp.]
MIRRKLCLLVGLGAATALLQAADPLPTATPPPGQFDNLIKNSPFGQASAPGSQPGSDGSTLEFRGVFSDGGQTYFSLYETASRKSQWVGLKENGLPYFVESYDPEKFSIQVKYRNQPLALTIKQAQIVVQAMPVAAPLPTNINAVPGAPAAAVAPASMDEAARMQQVAEEIRRRRALRSPPNLPQNQAPPATANGTPLINPPRPATPVARP